MAADYHTETPHILDFSKYPGAWLAEGFCFCFCFFFNIFLCFYFLWSKRNSFCLHQVWRIVKDLFVYIWALLVIKLLSFILFVQVILAVYLFFLFLFFYYEFQMNDHYHNIWKLQLVFISVNRKTQYCRCIFSFEFSYFIGLNMSRAL